MADKRIPFCVCKNPLSTETVVIDLSEYETCDKCGLPIESTEVPARDET